MSDERNALAEEHAERVRNMFAAIASRYDLLNHLLSCNVDKRWRRLVADALRERGSGKDARILDVACGTGDLALTLFETVGARVVGADFCRPMLEIAARKTATAGARIPLIEADALKLPFSDRSFDAVTIAFGLRNLANTDSGLRELLRVLRPGGKIAILECSKPVVPGFSSLFRLYFTKILPLLGGLISGSRSAYKYLPASVARFIDQQELVEAMRQAGFNEISYRNLTGGIAAIHLGTRPA